jgi:hypothetical protein
MRRPRGCAESDRYRPQAAQRRSKWAAPSRCTRRTSHAALGEVRRGLRETPTPSSSAWRYVPRARLRSRTSAPSRSRSMAAARWGSGPPAAVLVGGLLGLAGSRGKRRREPKKLVTRRLRRPGGEAFQGEASPAQIGHVGAPTPRAASRPALAPRRGPWAVARREAAEESGNFEYANAVMIDLFGVLVLPPPQIISSRYKFFLMNLVGEETMSRLGTTTTNNDTTIGQHDCTTPLNLT